MLHYQVLEPRKDLFFIELTQQKKVFLAMPRFVQNIGIIMVFKILYALDAHTNV